MKNNKRENLIRQIAIQEHKKASINYDLLTNLNNHIFNLVPF